MISVSLKSPLKKQDWESVFTKLPFRIGSMTILVLHQAVPPHILQQNCGHGRTCNLGVFLLQRNNNNTKFDFVSRR